MDGKIRMADIAEKLGISVVSVSKALSGKDGVSDQMREKIKQTAREMGYTPLRGKPKAGNPGVTGNIGILMADRFFADNNFYASLFRQVSLQCNAQGFSAMLEIVPMEACRNCTMPAIVQGNKVDGLIFMGQISQEYVRAVTKTGIPYVLVDFYDEELNAISVTSDNVVGGYRLTNHLLKQGRKDIGFVGSIQATSSIMDRFLGYTKALLRAGQQVRPDWVLEDRDARGAFLTLQLPQQMPQAFLCTCDEVAYNLVQQLRAMGLRVPEDVAVTGYDDYQIALLCKPQLTSYWVNTGEMSRIAVEQLVRSITGAAPTNGNIVVNGVLVRREST